MVRPRTTNDARLVDVEALRSILSYDPQTGLFTWIKQVGTQGIIGRVAGSSITKGYRSIKIAGVRYMAHRLAWLYVHGIWPADQIDHINGCTSDNRMANLREANSVENQQNRAINTNNVSGYPGVCWNIHRRKWQADIRIGARRIYLGLFATAEAAGAAYDSAKAIHHPFNPTVRKVSGGRHG